MIYWKMSATLFVWSAITVIVRLAVIPTKQRTSIKPYSLPLGKEADLNL